MSGINHLLLWAALVQPPVHHDDSAAERGWADPLLYRDLAAKSWQDWHRPEAVEMLSAILRGSSMAPGDGWFHGSVAKHDWKSFTTRLGLESEKTIKRKQFPGPIEWFDRLDRNRDGVLTPDDFDHTDKLPALRPPQMAMLLLRTLDTDGDGEISPAEWEAFFKTAAKGNESLKMGDLGEALRLAMMRMMMGGERLSPSMLTAGVLSGDVGSICEGPALGQRGLDFRLKTEDGKKTIKLSDFRGNKPVVLIFGSFS